MAGTDGRSARPAALSTPRHVRTGDLPAPMTGPHLVGVDREAGPTDRQSARAIGSPADGGACGPPIGSRLSSLRR